MSNTPATDSENLELYKLHAELADRVSQRRAAANRFFPGMLTGVGALFAITDRLGASGAAIPLGFLLMMGGFFGVALSLSWLLTIRSYRALSKGKFATLKELESKLSFCFFDREWKNLGGNHLELTKVEKTIPMVFMFAFFWLFWMGGALYIEVRETTLAPSQLFLSLLSALVSLVSMDTWGENSPVKAFVLGTFGGSIVMLLGSFLISILTACG